MSVPKGCAEASSCEGASSSAVCSLDSPGHGPTTGPDKNQREERASQLRMRAKHALSRRDFSGACRLLTEAIALCPQSYKLRRLRSVANACLNEYEFALEDAEAVIRLAPGVTDGYYHKGYALYHLKMFGEAAKAFQEGLKLSPHDRALRQGFWDSVTLLSQEPAIDETAKESERREQGAESTLQNAPNS
uniref:Stress-induced-phosphoprotein 1 n=1 Tax=Tetraselmis sp. GSL018 TaxID=582737 RepID=A0A061SDB6_9CHLO